MGLGTMGGASPPWINDLAGVWIRNETLLHIALLFWGWETKTLMFWGWETKASKTIQNLHSLEIKHGT